MIIEIHCTLQDDDISSAVVDALKIDYQKYDSDNKTRDRIDEMQKRVPCILLMLRIMFHITIQVRRCMNVFTFIYICPVFTLLTVLFCKHLKNKTLSN